LYSKFENKVFSGAIGVLVTHNTEDTKIRLPKLLSSVFINTAI
jgi:hypothetical protein